jgi:5'-nucleotidase
LQRYTVIELPISGVKVGVVGLTTIDTPEASSPGPNLKFMPYADTLPGCIADAKADGAEFIVALTHIGFSADKELAASAAAADIDLIVGE